jgi:hypothetical protein
MPFPYTFPFRFEEARGFPYTFPFIFNNARPYVGSGDVRGAGALASIRMKLVGLGSVTLSGIANKLFPASLGGTLTSAATLGTFKIFGILAGGFINATTTLITFPRKLLTGNVNLAAGLVRFISSNYGRGSVSSVGGLLNKTLLSFLAEVATAGSVVKRQFASPSGEIGIAAGILKRISIFPRGGLSASGVVLRFARLPRLGEATITTTGSVIKKTLTSVGKAVSSITGALISSLFPFIDVSISVSISKSMDISITLKGGGQ